MAGIRLRKIDGVEGIADDEGGGNDGGQIGRGQSVGMAVDAQESDISRARVVFKEPVKAEVEHLRVVALIGRHGKLQLRRRHYLPDIVGLGAAANVQAGDFVFGKGDGAAGRQMLAHRYRAARGGAHGYLRGKVLNGHGHQRREGKAPGAGGGGESEHARGRGYPAGDGNDEFRVAVRAVAAEKARGPVNQVEVEINAGRNVGDCQCIQRRVVVNQPRHREGVARAHRRQTGRERIVHGHPGINAGIAGAAAAAAARKRGIGEEGVGARGGIGYLTSVTDGMIGFVVGFNNLRISVCRQLQLLADVAVVDRHRHARNRGDDQTGLGAHSAVKSRREEIAGQLKIQFNARGDGLRVAADDARHCGKLLFGKARRSAGVVLRGDENAGSHVIGRIGDGNQTVADNAQGDSGGGFKLSGINARAVNDIDEVGAAMHIPAHARRVKDINIRRERQDDGLRVVVCARRRRADGAALRAAGASFHKVFVVAEDVEVIAPSRGMHPVFGGEDIGAVARALRIVARGLQVGKFGITEHGGLIDYLPAEDEQFVIQHHGGVFAHVAIDTARR